MADIVPIGPWPKGLNLKDPIGSLAQDELRACINCRLDTAGRILKRPGSKNYGNSTNQTNKKVNGDNLVNLLVRFHRLGNTEHHTVAAAGGHLTVINDITGEKTRILIQGNSNNLLNAVSLISQAVYKDTLLLADGVKPVRFDGTYANYANSYVSLAPTLTQPDAGAIPNGVYKYRLVPVYGLLGEGLLGTEASITVSGGPKKVHVAWSAPAASLGITAFRIYRSHVGATTPYLVDEVPVATGYLDDNAIDADLTREYAEVTGPPDDARFVMIGHDDRAYWFGMSGASANVVEVSDIGFPTVMLGDFLTVESNKDDYLVGGAVLPNGLLFFKGSSIWVCRGFGYPLENLSTSVGLASHFSIAYVPGGIIFVSNLGEVFFCDGTNLNPLGYKISPELQGLSESSKSRITATYHDYRYIISYDGGNSHGYNWKTLEYDLVNSKWDGPHYNLDKRCISYFSSWDNMNDSGELLWGEANPSNGSLLYILNPLQSLDQGLPFESVARSGRSLLLTTGVTLVHRVKAR